MTGISAFATYVPPFRLARADIGRALGTGGGRGTRAVARYDEDTTSLGVEAARRLVCGSRRVDGLYFATSAPAYADKTNATAIHAALGLDTSAYAFDLVGSVRNGVAALRAGTDAAWAGRRSIVVVADMRSGRPGSDDESQGGDAAAAFLFDDQDVLVDMVGAGSATAEFLERWRDPAASSSRVWEERFGEAAYLPLVEPAVDDALKDAGVVLGDVAHVIVTGLHARANRRVASTLGVAADIVAADRSTSIGNPGCAHGGLALCDVLEHAGADELVLLVSLADGVDALVLRTTSLLVANRDANAVTVGSQVADSTLAIDYPKFLTWRGVLDREPPRRPETTAPAAPPSFRAEAWKYAFVGSSCDRCGTRHMPSVRVCVNCRAVDQMTSVRLADVPGTIATFSIDHLSYSLSPPNVIAVIDFDGGGRFACEMTDVDPSTIAIGDRVEMSFRRMSTSGGVHNYFWKARPARNTTQGGS